MAPHLNGTRSVATEDVSRRWFDDPRLNLAVGFEDTFVPQVRTGERSLDEYELTDHYLNWYDDLGLLARTGANQARWGVPWYRVNPERNVWRFDWLDRVVARFAEIGVQPIVDLVHYGTPLWLDNGFVNHCFPERVAEYAARVAERYAGELTVFTPMNEPLLTAMYCGQYGHWPPHLRGDDGFVRLVGQLAKGICLTQRAVVEAGGAQTSFVHVEASFRFSGDISAFRDQVEFLSHRRFLVEDLVTGRVDDGHALVRYLLDNGMNDADLAWFHQYSVQPDVMGVNYYPQVSTERFVAGEAHDGGPNDLWPRDNAGVTGLADVLLLAWRRYGRPVYLTETSWPGPVNERIAWMDASMAAVDEMRSGGVPVIGYCWWSLFDMLFWTYRTELGEPQEYLAGMGLWDLAPDDVGHFRRIETAAADHFRRHAAQRRGAGSRSA